MPSAKQYVFVTSSIKTMVRTKLQIQKPTQGGIPFVQGVILPEFKFHDKAIKCYLLDIRPILTNTNGSQQCKCDAFSQADISYSYVPLLPFSNTRARDYGLLIYSAVTVLYNSALFATRQISKPQRELIDTNEEQQRAIQNCYNKYVEATSTLTIDDYINFASKYVTFDFSNDTVKNAIRGINDVLKDILQNLASSPPQPHSNDNGTLRDSDRPIDDLMTLGELHPQLNIGDALVLQGLNPTDITIFPVDENAKRFIGLRENKDNYAIQAIPAYVTTDIGVAQTAYTTKLYLRKNL